MFKMICLTKAFLSFFGKKASHKLKFSYTFYFVLAKETESKALYSFSKFPQILFISIF